jgi:hypothetical protein
VTIPATGHQNTDWITDVAPGATTPGSKHEVCLDCGTTLQQDVEIPATGPEEEEQGSEEVPEDTEEPI